MSKPRFLRRILGPVATTLGLAVCPLAVTAPSASAATMVLQGRFACNDGGSLAGVRVELLKIHSRLLPEIPPNVQVTVARHADANGGWGFRVSGGETNWRVRAVLVNSDVGVKDFGIPWHHYVDTLRTQNDRPLADYGTQIVPGAECRLWRAFKAAADGYRADTGAGHPAGTITVLDNAPTSGVPFSPYTDVFWPAGYSPSAAQHEFAHTVRHALDGTRAHFFVDTARFWYLRSHSGSSCDSTNHGFAFNEGWAEYWADDVQKTPCPNPNDFSIERNVAVELKRLQINQCVGVNRARMVEVLAQNRGRIHSMADFSNALGCVPRRVRKLGRAPRPVSDLLTLAAKRVKAGRGFLASASATVARARVALSQAHDSWAKTLSRGRLDQALALRKTFSYLANRAAQARIVRTSDRAQVSLILGKQRVYIRRLRAISVTTLRQGASVFKAQGDAAAGKLLDEARASAQRGDVGVLQAVGMPLPAASQAGPSPAGIDVIDVGDAPPPLGDALPPPLSSPAQPPPAPPPPPLPPPDLDLVISRVYGDAATAFCDILADVRNAGSAEAPATTTEFLSSQPGQFDELIATPALAAGQTTTVRVDREYGDYNRATVTADAGNLIAETDETNNTGFGSGSPTLLDTAEQNSARCRYP